MTPREASMALLQQIADTHGITLSALFEPNRSAHLARARDEAYFRLHTERKLTFRQIGALMQRTGTSVFYGANRYAELKAVPGMGIQAARAARKRAKARQRYHERVAAEREWRAYRAEQVTERTG